MEILGPNKMLIGGQVRRFERNERTRQTTLFEHRWLETIAFILRHPNRYMEHLFGPYRECAIAHHPTPSKPSEVIRSSSSGRSR